ncbi:MAG: DUF1800 family protein [Opitutaceae bacterium]|nr:DUF1800 family protein [Opitutaceae bacterium]
MTSVVLRRVVFALFVLLSAAPFQLRAQVVNVPPQSQSVTAGASTILSVGAAGTALTYQWQRNGVSIPNGTEPALLILNVQPETTGIYTVVVSSGTNSVSASAVLALASGAKIIGAGREVGTDIRHPTGNIYDQILLEGTAATITADPGQVTRISYVDLNNDIVQVEFAGAGALTLVLDSPTGPATPILYNQPTVAYMKGHGHITIADANETTNVSVFSVGRANAVNQALFKSDVVYDGVADIAFVGVHSTNGKFGGIRTANSSFFAAVGATGVVAPTVQFLGPVFLGDINAFDTASPMLVLGSAADVRITGGDLLQSNSRPVQVGGFSQLRFTDGSTSHGTLIPAQTISGRLVQGAIDMTNTLTGKSPNAPLYFGTLSRDAAASNSTASGYATITIKEDGTALVNVSFSNLSAPQVSAYLRLAPSGDLLLGLGLGQVNAYSWTFQRVGNTTTDDLIFALNHGNIFVSVNSALFPDGELRGTFLASAGSQTFTAPPAPAAVSLVNVTAVDAARFLTQATFGPKRSEITALTGGSITAWIDAQMAMPFSSHRAATLADQVAFGGSTSVTNWNAVHYINRQSAWFKHALTAPDQLRQRVAFALTQIFVVSEIGIDGDNRMEGLANYIDMLGAGAFGNFRTLLEGVSLSPIMGEYLSSLRNGKADPVTGTTPDENYAREVMQLFTIGLNQLQPDGTLKLDAAGLPIPTYHQTTITEMAKVFTGWAYPSTNLNNFRSGGQNFISPMQLFPAFHDDGPKNLSPVLTTPIPAAQGGAKDLQLALDGLFNHPNTGPFIARKLIQRLVTSNPSPAYVYRVAQKFENNGSGVRGDLGAVIRAILTDYEARSPAILGNMGYGKLKEPLLRLTGILRSFGASSRIGRFAGHRYSINGIPTTGATPNPIEQSAVVYAGGQSTTNLQTNLAEAPQVSPTVFNFFLPDYTVPGPLAAAGLVAPEFQITDATFSISVPNTLRSFVLANNSAATVAADATLVLDLAYEQTLVSSPTALLDHLGLLLAGGNLSSTLRTRVTSALAGLPASATLLDRAQSAVLIIATSSDGAIQK